MATVYSRLLGFVASGTSGSPHDFTVPLGKTWIVRDADAFHEVNPLGSVLLIDHTNGLVFASLTFAVANSSLQWTGRQVFVAGSTLRVSITAGTIDVRISGYELDA